MTLAAPANIDTLWYTRCSVPTLFGLAAQFAWFEQEFAPDGIIVKALRESADPAEQASHFTHSLRHSFRQGGSVPPIWARGQGVRTKVIGITWTDEYQAIIALPQSGIRSVRDLRGRRVGIPHHGSLVDHNRISALRAFTVALETEGLSLRDVELKDLADTAVPLANDPRAPDATVTFAGRRRRHSYTNEVYALVRGEVDAVYVKDVRGAEVTQLLGAVIIFDLGFHPDPYIRVSNCTPRPLTVNEETIENHPEIVSRFLRQVVKAGEWAAMHPDDATALVARETGWSERWLRRAYGEQLHRSLSVELSEDSIKGLGVFKDYIASIGALDQDFNIHDWIDPRPLAEVQARIRTAA